MFKIEFDAPDILPRIDPNDANSMGQEDIYDIDYSRNTIKVDNKEGNHCCSNCGASMYFNYTNLLTNKHPINAERDNPIGCNSSTNWTLPQTTLHKFTTTSSFDFQYVCHTPDSFGYNISLEGVDVDVHPFDDNDDVDVEYSEENHSLTFQNTYGIICDECAAEHYVYSVFHGCYIHIPDSVSYIHKRLTPRNSYYIDLRYAQEHPYIYANQYTDRFPSEYVSFQIAFYNQRSRNLNTPRIIQNYHASQGNTTFIASPWIRGTGRNINTKELNNVRYFGVELEVECSNSRAKDSKAAQINDYANNGVVGQRCFFERDSSLNNGFEIITQPMGLDKHREFWKWLDNPDLIKNIRSHDTDTCGLHIHVSKKRLTKLQISKVIQFLNNPSNYRPITKIARRNSERWGSINTKKKLKDALQNPKRYDALNITTGKTIEFRLFRGSLKYNTVVASIEFVNAITLFSSPTIQTITSFDVAEEPNQWANFCKFIQLPWMKQDTTVLREHLKSKRILVN
tara:strand:+ start:554 stop:2086 length:1533 start_codon:yes stop_codon:yes gene_type:complete